MSTAARHNYEYAVDLEAQTAPAYVVALVGSDKRVLEVGCGPGSITKMLAAEGQCRVTGLELDLSAIEKVKPFCEEVLQADLNSSTWPELVADKERFDVVVAADVLEHLYDPWSTLKLMAPLISDEGYLVISLPHVGHAAVASCLLTGDFEYRDWGLLDRTHIRFFGLRNIEQLFEQAQLKIVDVRFVVKPPEQTEFADKWATLSVPVQAALRSSPHADVYQVVVKAVPIDREGVAMTLVPPPVQSVAVASQGDLKRKIAARLTPEIKQRIRQGLRLIGVRV